VLTIDVFIVVNIGVELVIVACWGVYWTLYRRI